MTSFAKSRKRVLSGMRPTGKLHLGNYVGALQNWVRMQDEYECFFMVADWHALTTDYADTLAVKENSLEVTLDWLAAGLDPEKSVIFIQSHVPAHAELHLLFSMITPLGWLERVPTYKEQRENIKDKDLGDVRISGISRAAVGGHSGLQGRLRAGGRRSGRARGADAGDCAAVQLFYPRHERGIGFQLWNGPASDRTGSRHVFVFPEPQSLLTPAAKLPGTDGRKMSKSYGNTIMLTDPEPVVRQKLKTMVTDPARVRRIGSGESGCVSGGRSAQDFQRAKTRWPK